GGGGTTLLPGGRGRPRALAFTPDGRRLAVSSLDNTGVTILDLPGGAVVRVLSHPAPVRDVAWGGPRGCFLACACDDFNVHVWNVERGDGRAAPSGHADVVTRVAFSRSRSLLASASWDGSVRLWDPVLGRPVLATPGESAYIGRDGTAVAVRQGRDVGLWALA